MSSAPVFVYLFGVCLKPAGITEVGLVVGDLMLCCNLCSWVINFSSIYKTSSPAFRYCIFLPPCETHCTMHLSAQFLSRYFSCDLLSFCAFTCKLFRWLRETSFQYLMSHKARAELMLRRLGCVTSVQIVDEHGPHLNAGVAEDS